MLHRPKQQKSPVGKSDRAFHFMFRLLPHQSLSEPHQFHLIQILNRLNISILGDFVIRSIVLPAQTLHRGVRIPGRFCRIWVDDKRALHKRTIQITNLHRNHRPIRDTIPFRFVVPCLRLDNDQMPAQIRGLAFKVDHVTVKPRTQVIKSFQHKRPFSNVKPNLGFRLDDGGKGRGGSAVG